MNVDMNALPFETITIDGFRGLRDLRLEGLGAVNILVGDNNSGKTSVLEAMSIACNPFGPQEWLAMIRRRDFGGLDENRGQSLRWCFPQSGALRNQDFMFKGRCEINSQGRYPLRKLVAEVSDIQGIPSLNELKRMRRLPEDATESIAFAESWRGIELKHVVEMNDAADQPSPFGFPTVSTTDPITLQFWDDDDRMGPILSRPRQGNLPSSTLTPYSYQINQLQLRSHSSQLFQGNGDAMEKREHVLDLIRQFDPEITDIQIASYGGLDAAIYLNHKRLGPAPLSVFGDALRRAVLLSSTLPKLVGGLLMIDEIETGIHISSLVKVFDWLMKTAKQFDVQVIATTHSLEAIDGILAASGDNLDDLVTFHLDNDGDRTDAKRIYGDLLRRMRHQRGLDVR